MQNAQRTRLNWALRHSYVFIAIAGATMLLLAGPVSNIYYPTEDQLSKALESKDLAAYSDLRYDYLGVWLVLVFGGSATLFLAASLFTYLHLKAYFAR